MSGGCCAEIIFVPRTIVTFFDTGSNDYASNTWRSGALALEEGWRDDELKSRFRIVLGTSIFPKQYSQRMMYNVFFFRILNAVTFLILTLWNDPLYSRLCAFMSERYFQTLLSSPLILARSMLMPSHALHSDGWWEGRFFIIVRHMKDMVCFMIMTSYTACFDHDILTYFVCMYVWWHGLLFE